MSDFNAATQAAIARASTLEPADRNCRDRTLLMLASGEWVGGLELALKAGGLGDRSRITELRQSGIPVECRPTPGRLRGEAWHQYRLPPAEQR